MVCNKVYRGRALRVVVGIFLLISLSSLFWGIASAASVFNIGDTVEVQNSLSSGLRVRDVPAGNQIGGKFDGDRGIILEGPQGASLGGTTYTWWRIRWNDGLIGWSAEGYPGGVYYLKKVPPPTPTVTPTIPPSLTSPGSSSSPGPTISTLTPTFQWSGVSGADYYGLYIRDLSTNTLVFDSQARGIQITGSYYTLPSGVLQEGKPYRWNMNSHNSAGWGSYSNVLYFQTTTYTISVSTSPSGLNPQPSGGGTYNYGQTVTVTAPTITGYTFQRWTENSNQVSTSASYSFTVTGNRNLVAVYTIQYTISTSTSPTGLSPQPTGGGTYNSGTSITVVAQPVTGYTFQKWTENGVQLSTSASYPLTVTGNRNLIAVYIQDKCWSPAPFLSASLADIVRQHFPEGIVPQTGENIRVTAYAVAKAESGGNPTACGDNDKSIGIWQIYTPAHPEYNRDSLFDFNSLTPQFFREYIHSQ